MPDEVLLDELADFLTGHPHAGDLQALERAGLPHAARNGVRFHDLRHTCASLWFEAGIPLAVISRWLGLASVAVTDRVHVHLRPDDDHSVPLQMIFRLLALRETAQTPELHRCVDR